MDKDKHEEVLSVLEKTDQTILANRDGPKGSGLGALLRLVTAQFMGIHEQPEGNETMTQTQTHGDQHGKDQPDAKHSKDTSAPQPAQKTPPPKSGGEVVSQGMMNIDRAIIATTGGSPGTGIVSLLELCATQFMGISRAALTPPPPPEDQPAGKHPPAAGTDRP